MIKKWRSYLFHYFTIGFILSLVVIFILAKYLPRYYTELVDQSVLSNKDEIYYFDLDNDGNSEKISYYHYDRIFQPTLYLYDSKDNFKFLWNFFESPIKKSFLFAGDYNNDSIKEIFVFTQKLDSIFLYVLNSENDRKNIVDREFIAFCNDSDSKFEVIPIGLYNLNQTKDKEFLFSVNNAYPNVPNKIFCFDIASKKIISSPEIDADILNSVVIEDINLDGKPEILVPNQSVDAKGSESESKLIVLNNKLEYLFQPIIFQGGTSKITTSVINSAGVKLIAVLNSGVNSKNVFNDLMLYNYKGEQVNETSIDGKANLSLVHLSNLEKDVYMFSGNKMYKYDSDLKKDGTYSISHGEKTRLIQNKDLTGDSSNELIFKGDNNFIIASNDLKYKAKIGIPGTGKINISIAKKNNETNHVSIQVGNNWYLYKFIKNEAFFYSHIFYFSIFIFMTFLSFLASKGRSKIKQLKKSAKKSVDKGFLNEMEENIEGRFKNLKTTIKEVSSELKAGSYHKIIEEIDETINQVKSVSEKISNKEPGNNIDKRFNALLNNHKKTLNIIFNVFPESGLKEFNSQLKDAILTFSETCFDIILSYKKQANVLLQIIKHDDYLNLLIEVENVFIDFSDLDNNEKLLSTLKEVNGRFEFDSISGFGTIINSTIPYDFNPTLGNDKVKRIKVIIAEDHDVSLFGLISLFKTKDDIEIIGTAKNGMEVLKLLESKNADIVITDISMPGMDGIELSGRLKEEYPDIKVIVFTMYMENWFVEQLINNDAKGFVSKSSRMAELVGAVRSVYEGHNYYCPQFKSKFGFKGNNGIEKKLNSLTKNEMQIVKQYAEDLTKDQIATKMEINDKTIDTFIANILLKLNAGDEDEIIRIAKKQKFISE